MTISLTANKNNQPKEYTAAEHKKKLSPSFFLVEELDNKWRMNYEQYNGDAQDKVYDNLVKLYIVLWDQCNTGLKNMD